MAFCANCGSQVEGRFCARCGAPVAPGSAATGPEVPPPAAPAPAGGLSDNVAAALCYLLTIVTGVLFLVLEPYNKNKLIRFHAFQAIFLGVAWFVAVILLASSPLRWRSWAFIWSGRSAGWYIWPSWCCSSC